MNGLTEFTLIHQPGQIEHWVRFGHHISERIVDRRRRLLLFRPDQMVAFVRWASNAFGTIESRIDIVRTVPPKAASTTLPFVRPGAELFLSLRSWPKVEAMLKLIDAAEATAGDAASVCPAYWRHVEQLLSCGMQPGPYTMARHRAWQLRRELGW